MRYILLIGLFLLTLAWGIASNIPLSTAMRYSGAADQSFSWRQARGTIWNGQVTGITIGRTPAGHAELQLRAADLPKGRVAYDTRWAAPYGRGAAILRPKRSSIAIEDLTADIFTEAAPFADARLRDLGANFRLEKAALDVRQDGCADATGLASTDFVRLAGQQFGRDWPSLEGELTCKNGALVVAMTGEGASGETFTLAARYSVSTGFTYSLEAAGLDFEAQSALSSSGFIVRDGASFFSNTNIVRNAQ